MNVRRSLTLTERFDAHDTKVKLTSVVTSVAMVLTGLVAFSTVTASSASAAPTTYKVDVAVEAGRTVGAPSADPATLITGGDPVAHWNYTLQKLNVGDPNDAVTDCLPPVNGPQYDANYPNNCDWSGTRESNNTDPIISTGTEADIAATVGTGLMLSDPNNPLSAKVPLDGGQYLISVHADGYEIGGAHFTLPRPDNGPIVVKLQPGPLPLATVRIRVFEDTVPVDGTYEIGAEPGLQGFRGYLSDMLGDVSTDFFGNPLCTTYATGPTDATHPERPILFDDTGAPIIAGNSTGSCLSNVDGDIVIPNMAPGRYGITVRQPANKTDWYQTTTLEGATDHDWWVMAGDTGYGSETVWGSELVPEVQFGFIPPQTSSAALDGGVSAYGGASITGKVHRGCMYIGSPGGQVGGAVNVKGAAGPETMDCGAIKNAVVAVSGLDVGDQQVANVKADANGSYTVPNLADGSYMVTFLDTTMTHIIETQNVTINGGQSEDMGTAFLSTWFARVSGYVFVDTNGNGKKDPGEQGVSGTTLTLRERDNTPMDQFTNLIDTDSTGHYDIDQAYPLTRYLILEHVNSRYKPTGYTVQSCNDPESHTYTGAAVDISFLPVLGLCGTVDWAVEPFASDATGGIAGTVSYGVTRNELDAAQAATEDWQPGIPGVTVHLWAPVICGTPLAADSQYAAAASSCVGRDGEPMTSPIVKDSNGDTVGGGELVHGPELTDPYVTETYHRPSGCTALDRLGNPLTEQKALPEFGNTELQCVESNMLGTQAKPQDGTESVPGEPTLGDNGQEVNGNYGFGTSKLNLVAPPAGGGIAQDALGNDLVIQGTTTPLPQFADLAANGLPEQDLLPMDYIVSVDIPKDSYGKPKFKITREEDVNIFQGDQFMPQENFPLDSAAQGSDGAGAEGAGLTSGLGVVAPCAGPEHTVRVTDPDFLAGGGSPFEGKDMPLCTDKLVTVQGGSTAAPNFEMFTDVPLATHFWGLILNDLGLQADPTSIGFDEAEGIPHAATGVYDWFGNLVDTVEADRNGFYEAVEPSTTRINNPSPTGVSPGMYRFVGNDPGQPGHLNKTYDPRYRTIATNFQAWPGLWTVTDTAPTAAASSTFTGGAMTLVKCDVPTGEPQVFRVSDPVAAGASSLTITGRDFGSRPGNAGSVVDYSQVLIGAPNAPADNPNGWTALNVTSWAADGTSIAVDVPAAGPGFAPGPRQLMVINSSGKHSVAGVTIHVTGSDATTTYDPTIFRVGPGLQYDTDNNATIQDALQAAAALGANASTLVVVFPGSATTITPRGEYAENLVIHSGVKLQGVGGGGTDAGGNWVAGTVITGEAFAEGQPSGTNWNALVANTSYVGATVTVPDSATITVLTPPGTQSTTRPAIDGFRITGGHEQNVTTNINVITNGQQTPYGSAGAVITQGGGIYVHAGSNNLTISNNTIEGNSGTYGGAIRVGTPFANGNVNASSSTNAYTVRNTNLTIAHNRLNNNGGYNLAGGVGLFSGTAGYRLAYNDVCGNFGGEYGGGISHYGFSGGTNNIDHNRIWANQSYDEGAGVMLSGEITLNGATLSGGTGVVNVSANRIAQNIANDDGGGLRLLNAGSQRITIDNNEIANNVSAHEGGGIGLNDASNTAIVNNTIVGNVTTATAATSNGQPAAAGIATSKLSAQLQAALPAGSPTFTNPVLFNNILWDNRAGTYDGNAVTGVVGAPGDPSLDIWDLGSQDSSGLVSPTNSILSAHNIHNRLGANAISSPTNKVGIDPLFVKAFTPTLIIDSRRAFGTFRQTVIFDQTTSPWDSGDYAIASGSSAFNAGAASKVAPAPSPVNAPATDITNFPRPAGGGFDAGSWEYRTGASVPGAPTAVTAVTSGSGIAVSWTAPVSTGGAPLKGYTARAWSALSGGTTPAFVCTTTVTNCTITGVNPVTTYYVDVVATNPVGASVAAPAPRITVGVASIPAAPTGVVVGSVNNGLTVTWNRVTSTPLPTSYTARAYSALTGGVLRGSCNVNQPATGATVTCTINGLTNGTTYYVDVVSIRNTVPSAPSPSPRVTAKAGVLPGAPPVSNGGTTAGRMSVNVTWSQPGTTGGTITGYTAQAFTAATGGSAASFCTTNGAGRSCVIPGLTAGTPYYIVVFATNGIGNGPAGPVTAGARTLIRTPLAAVAPGQPTGVAGLAGDHQVELRWTAPTSTGVWAGAPLTYRVEYWKGTNTPTVLPDTTATALKIIGLVNGGTPYHFRVSARNAFYTGVAPTGPWGLPSSTNGVLITANPARPQAPTGVVVQQVSTATSGRLSVSWVLGSDRGRAITSSTVRVWSDATAGAILGTCTVVNTGTTCTVTGLQRFRTYYVDVISRNSMGASDPSAPRVAKVA